ncbi:MAG TPA: carboxymuconolactone decarboxylase family protein [Acidimicrobiales bacterium]
MATPTSGPAGEQPRITPGDRRDVGLVNWTISAVSGRATGTGPPNLFLTLGRHRRLFRGWLRFAGRLMPGGRLPRRETELVILRVAHRRDCRYELAHHARLGRRAGLSPADVAAATGGPPAGGSEGRAELSDREQAMLRAADVLVAERDLDDATWALLRRHLDEREAIELCLLVGHYDMLATAIAALRIQPDEP